MTMRAENRCHVLLLPGREIQVSAKEKPRSGFECHVLYGISVVNAL
tara:strand:+ start:783 stop:920 length:138 start_codon:yes stop_codon:yes gene_type:complete